MVAEKKIFSCFYFYKSIENMWPLGGAIFGHKSIIWTNLVKVH